MRKIAIICLVFMLLTGCKAEDVFETLGSVAHQPAQLSEKASLQLTLPESASLQTFGSGADKLYECDGYCLVLQTLDGGDLSRTVKNLSGFAPEKLTILQTATPVTRYDWTWTAVGESGEMIFRAAVLDDGNYHYCLTAFAPAVSGGALAQQWNALFGSFGLDEAR